MMKAAITVWGKRVSPVFDSAQKLLVAEIADQKIINRQYERFDPDLPHLLAERLIKSNITVFLCGAISAIPANTIELSGIRLISFITGDVDAILQAVAEGMPIIPAFLMPGCKCRHRLHRRKGKNIIDKEERKCRDMTGQGPQGQGS